MEPPLDMEILDSREEEQEQEQEHGEEEESSEQEDEAEMSMERSDRDSLAEVKRVFLPLWFGDELQPPDEVHNVASHFCFRLC